MDEKSFLSDLQGKRVLVELLGNTIATPAWRTGTLVAWDASFLFLEEPAGTPVMISRQAVATISEAASPE